MNFLSPIHEEAWNCALEILKPTQAQLEHGLEIHNEFFTMDHFGFLPTSARTNRFGELFSALREKNVGQRELIYYYNHILAETDEAKKQEWIGLCLLTRKLLLKHLDILAIDAVESM